MHKKITFRNQFSFRLFLTMMTLVLSSSGFFGQDSIKNTRSIDVLVANISLHVIGDAKISGNINYVAINISKTSTEKNKLATVTKKSKDKVKIFKEKKLRKVLANRKFNQFFLPTNNSENFSYKTYNGFVFITSNDTQKSLRTSSVLARNEFCFKTKFIGKNVFSLNKNYSNSYYLNTYQNCVDARPPPNWV